MTPELQMVKLLSDKAVAEALVELSKDWRGEKGEKGEPGRVPVKGEDYFTAEEIDSIVAYVRSLIKDGKDGKDGKSIVGPEGPKGDKGLDGKNGKDGKDGVAPTAEDVAKILKKFPVKYQEIEGAPKIKDLNELITFLKAGGFRGGGGSGSGGGGTPGGSNTQVQYNNAGSFGGITGATTNGTVVTLTSPVIATSQTNSYATASTIAIFDASKNLISAPLATYPSLTELSYVKGVTSAIQTQIDGKLANTVANLVGTANQVVLSASGTGVLVGSTNITLSLPQSIATTSTPQFARLGLGVAASAVYGLNLTANNAGDYAAAIRNTSTTGYGLYLESDNSTTNPVLDVNTSGGTVNFRVYGGTTGGVAIGSVSNPGLGNLNVRGSITGGSGISANTTMLTLSGGSITGSGTTSFQTLTGTWNTSGVVDGAVRIAITETASGANSSLFSIYGGASATTNYVTVAKAGLVGISNSTPDSLLTIGPGTIAFGAAASRRVVVNGAGQTDFFVQNTSNSVIFRLTAENGVADAIIGTASNHPFGIITNNATIWSFATAGHFLASTDNTYDIGASGATRPRSLFLGSNATIGGTLIATPDTRTGAGAVSVTTLSTKIVTAGVADALTLADGVAGQIKILDLDVVTTGGDSAVLTPTTKTGYTTITFSAAGQTATLMFFATRGWSILSLRGAVAA